MARKRDADVKTAMEGWLTGDGPDTADAPELDALALYRRAGVDGELVAMAQNGRAWRVPDRAGGWAARSELRDVSAHGLTRLGAQAEARARARVAAAAGALDRAELVRRAAETARVAYAEAASTPTPTPAADPGAPTPAAPARARTDKRRMVGAYLDAAEVEALEARAAADDRSVSYIVRAAVRAYLGMT